MNLAQLVRVIASLVLVCAAAGCAESQSSPGREPRSSVVPAPYVDSTRSGAGYAPKYAGAPARIDRMRQ